MYWPGLQGCGKPPFLSSRQLQCLCLLFLNVFHGKLDCLKKKEKKVVARVSFKKGITTTSLKISNMHVGSSAATYGTRERIYTEPKISDHRSLYIRYNETELLTRRRKIAPLVHQQLRGVVATPVLSILFHADVQRWRMQCRGRWCQYVSHLDGL